MQTEKPTVDYVERQCSAACLLDICIIQSGNIFCTSAVGLWRLPLVAGVLAGAFSASPAPEMTQAAVQCHFCSPLYCMLSVVSAACLVAGQTIRSAGQTIKSCSRCIQGVKVEKLAVYYTSPPSHMRVRHFPLGALVTRAGARAGGRRRRAAPAHRRPTLPGAGGPLVVGAAAAHGAPPVHPRRQRAHGAGAAAVGPRVSGFRVRG